MIARSRTLSGPLGSPGVAFVGVVLLGGLNAVAVRIAAAELAPFWSAALRFGIAGVVLTTIVLATRTPMPTGAALGSSVLYGAVGFAATFGLIHWALIRVPPASVQTILAIVPLLTLVLAIGQGLERIRAASVGGAVIALAGVGLVFGDRLGAGASPLAMVAVVVGAACMAQSNIILKRSPRCHPLSELAVGLLAGAGLLLAASIVTSEPLALPRDGRTWGALAYVSLAGTGGVFLLFGAVVRRWSASSTSSVMLLMPIVTVVAAAIVLGQAITPSMLAGGALVLGGVYIGAIGRDRARSGPVAPESHARVATPQPGCA
jgi:drug/metabolite transporter (DMT)-like permease